MSADLERLNAIIARSPAARFLNLGVDGDAAGRVYRLGFREAHIGNPLIRALHGGVVATFLEAAAEIELAAETGFARFQTISVQIDYLRGADAEDMFARARLIKVGRRVAVADAIGWQASEEKPVARAALSFRMPDA
ncbi:MAG: PaaI family thioesterase [Pseudomonadota bacterium]